MSTDVRVCNSTSLPNPTPTPLPNDLAVCHSMIVELLEAIKQSQHECDGLRHRLDQLLRRLYGSKAERFDPNQPWLIADMAVDPATANGADTTAANNGDAADAADAADEADKDKPKRKGHGRNKLSKDLPRRRVEHTLAEA